jgi:FkbM family methyltransferase
MIAVEFLRFLLVSLPFKKGKWRISKQINSLIVNAKIGANRTVRTRYGFSMALNLGDFVDRQIYASNDWDSDVGHIISNLLRPGDTFLDVGANIGYFSILASRIVGEHGLVVALEPNPVVFTRFLENIKMNKIETIEPICLGASNQPGSAPLFLEGKGHTGAGSLMKSPISTDQTIIKLDSLDHIFASRNLPTPNLIKIDVEGAEVLALEGMRNILAQSDAPPLLVEVSEWGLTEMGYSIPELVGLLEEFGYTMQRISRIRTSKWSKAKSFEQYDALFTKK